VRCARHCSLNFSGGARRITQVSNGFVGLSVFF
jgi:hypothetical protein